MTFNITFICQVIGMFLYVCRCATESSTKYFLKSDLVSLTNSNGMLENWFVGMSAPSWQIEVALKIKIFDFFFLFFEKMKLW